MHRIPRPPGRRRGQPNDPAAREQLLTRAIMLFSERGIANTTVAKIAEVGEVSPAMVHYWFTNREGLLDAIVEERLVPVFDGLWNPVGLDGVPAPEMVHELVRRLLAITRDRPWAPSLWLREVINEGGLLRERVLRRVPLTRLAAFVQAIAQGQPRGEVTPGLQPLLMPVSIVALVMLPQAAARIWQQINPALTLDREALERHVVALLMHGVCGPTPAAFTPSAPRSLP